MGNGKDDQAWDPEWLSPGLWSVFTNDLQEHCPKEIKCMPLIATFSYSSILKSKNK